MEATRQENRKRIRKPRVPVTDAARERLFSLHATRSAAVLARRTGLPYLLVYNVVHGRVASVSDRHYRMLFGSPPTPGEATRVDGARFRALVVLWCYLDDRTTLSDLYRELHGAWQPRRPDLRIFTGAVRTVPYRLERRMREKFAAAGIDDDALAQWLDEMALQDAAERVPYHRIRPLLQFLHERVGIHPTALLHQSVKRYERGVLKRVAGPVYRRVLALKQQADQVLATGSAREIEAFREAVVGKKPGYTLFVAVAEEVDFLRRYGRRGAKHYLGRGVHAFDAGHLRRIPDWRARRIAAACDRLIDQLPDLPVAALPRSRRRRLFGRVRDVLVARTAQLLSEQDGLVFERGVLRPLHAQAEYRKHRHGFTRFDMAPSVLGMRRRAFDLMVARNCEIFRSVGHYAKRWYVSDLYLKELSHKDHFELISAKYERMAASLKRKPPADACRLH